MIPMPHRKNNNTKCMQENRLNDIEKDIGKLDEKQDHLSEAVVKLTTEVSYVKWLLVLIIGLVTTMGGTIAIELFKIL